MRHHRHNPDYHFVENPVNFNKHTDKQLLQYCLGATMYMPATYDFLDKIINDKLPGLTSIVLDFEDALDETKLAPAEENVLDLLKEISARLEAGTLSDDVVPLIFCRVRNPQQFRSFAQRLHPEHLRALAGINFPKFNAENGMAYLETLRWINDTLGDIVYGMPIIEDQSIAFIETRTEQLLAIRKILDENRDIILHVRVGATDFSSVFGVRRGIDYTIYDIKPIADILSDVLNVFGRHNDYVISGPVWEYFRADKSMKFAPLPAHDIQESLIRHIPIYNGEVDGLLRETIMDRANGFIGKTVIHPSHIKFVNALYAVTKEEYHDALQILDVSGGVAKSQAGNKMNEINPHRSWAERIISRAQAYGVIEDGTEYLHLFAIETA